MAEKTIKVRLLVSRSGAGGAHDRGAVVEVGAAEAKRMIEAAQAEEIETTRKARG